MPSPALPSATLPILRDCVLPAGTLAIIIFLESIVVGKMYSNKYGYALSANRELVALGVANLSSSCLGSIPCSGSFVRSAAGDMAGARTQLACALSALVAFIIISCCLPLMRFLPRGSR